jgi:hypothetical protein
MAQTIRRFLTLAPALVLVAGLATAARPLTPRDRVSEICVIGGDIVYCAPYDR